jgi:hypothetical protein
MYHTARTGLFFPVKALANRVHYLFHLDPSTLPSRSASSPLAPMSLPPRSPWPSAKV